MHCLFLSLKVSSCHIQNLKQISKSWKSHQRSGSASQLPAVLSCSQQAAVLSLLCKGQDGPFEKCLSTRIWSFTGCTGESGKLAINQRPPGMEAWTPAWQILSITHLSCCKEPAGECKCGSLSLQSQFCLSFDISHLSSKRRLLHSH